MLHPALAPLALAIALGHVVRSGEALIWVDNGRDGRTRQASFALAAPEEIGPMKDLFMELQKNDTMKDGTLRRSAQRGKTKVLMAIFTTLSWRDYQIRELLRATWMRHPDVCAAQRMNMIENCTIGVLFLAGERAKKGSSAKFLAAEPDVMVLNMPENMNRGKTFNWFFDATRGPLSAQFQWAEYIAKVDNDVFVHVANFIDSLPVNTACQAYLGKPWTCRGKTCPNKNCGPPINHNYTQYKSESIGCWTYMQGGLYALSRELAFDIAEQDGFFFAHRIGHEDVLTGQAVADWVRRKGTGSCIHVWNSSEIAHDRIFYHMHGYNEHPGDISEAWDSYYQYDSRSAENSVAVPGDHVASQPLSVQEPPRAQ